MRKFSKEIGSGEIHVRDKWQFEYKSAFRAFPKKKYEYVQEFYMFIPSSLQVNENTYTKEQFYKDQINLIRYKTPEFTLKELLRATNSKSPFNRIRKMKTTLQKGEQLAKAQDEIKLLGSIYRTSLRNKIQEIVASFNDVTNKEMLQKLIEDVKEFSNEIDEFRAAFLELQTEMDFSAELKPYFDHLDEYRCNTSIYYLTGFLELISKDTVKDFKPIEKIICEQVIKEEQYQTKNFRQIDLLKKETLEDETIVQRNNLLNKLVSSSLLLNTTRKSFVEKYKNLIAGFSAGVAMLIFLLLLIWNGQMVLNTTTPYIVLTVVLYIIKDRLKEGLRTVSYEYAFRIFSDYTTQIRSPNDQRNMGLIKESFTFVEETSLSKEIQNIRKYEFPNILEDYIAPEKIIYYKKKIIIRKNPQKEARRFGLNILFRYNIQNFLYKADDPYIYFMQVDPKTKKFVKSKLPKVYYVHVILKTTYQLEDHSRRVEYKKFRLALDKNGIKHIDTIK